MKDTIISPSNRVMPAQNILKSPLSAQAAAEWRLEAASCSSVSNTRSSANISISEPVKPATHVTLVQGASITPEPVSWLWEGWLARGKAHIFGGAPGSGKTTIAVNLAATISTGGKWPDNTNAPVGNVIIWSGEDDARDTLAPRLIAANADMARILFVGDTNDNGKARSFDPAKDIEPLQTAIRDAGGAAMLIVDPLVSAVAADSHKNGEVRRALQPLVDLASQEGAALLGITHFSKNTAGREPTERITGSLAFGALARIVLVAAKISPEDHGPTHRVFMRSKSNIGPDDGGFEYELCQVELTAHPGISASCVDWGAAIEGTAREVLAVAENPSSRETVGAVKAASIFLQSLLADGPMAAEDIRSNVDSSGVSWSAVRRAQKSLGIVAAREGYGAEGRWLWSLPRH